MGREEETCDHCSNMLKSSSSVRSARVVSASATRPTRSRSQTIVPSPHTTTSSSATRNRCNLLQHRREASFVVRSKWADEVAAEDGDSDFEDRLAKLRAAKGVTGRGQGGAKAKKREEEASSKAKKIVDYTNETVFFDSKPSAGDLAVNVALGATLLWLPLSIAAVGRYIWVNYKITDKRVSVSNTSPTQSEQTDVGYEEISDVVAIGRGLGFWGDMVINLKDGSKVEIRSIDKWQEIKKYIEDRVAEVKSSEAPVEKAAAKGF